MERPGMMIYKWNILIISLVAAMVFLTQVSHGKSLGGRYHCRYRCDGDFAMCTPQARSTDVYIVCVLMRDLCMSSCKKRKQRQPSKPLVMKRLLSFMNSRKFLQDKATSISTTVKPNLPKLNQSRLNLAANFRKMTTSAPEIRA